MVWKATAVIWVGVGLAHMVAALTGREVEWGPKLVRLFRIGFWIVWLGFVVIVLQFLVLD